MFEILAFIFVHWVLSVWYAYYQTVGMCTPSTKDCPHFKYSGAKWMSYSTVAIFNIVGVVCSCRVLEELRKVSVLVYPFLIK